MNKVQSLDDVFPLEAGRAHEVSGAGSNAFAAMLAGQLGGTVLWRQSRWQSEGLHPFGLKAFYNLARAVIVKCKDQFEILGAAEDALRSRATSLVIAGLCACHLSHTPWKFQEHKWKIPFPTRYPQRFLKTA